MPRARTRVVRPADALPVRTALVLSTVVFLSACTSSAEIGSERRSATAAGHVFEDGTSLRTLPGRGLPDEAVHAPVVKPRVGS